MSNSNTTRICPKCDLSYYVDEAGKCHRCGTTEFDEEKNKFKATIIAQSEPEIKFEAWDDDPVISILKCLAKWRGIDMQNAENVMREALEQIAHDPHDAQRRAEDALHELFSSVLEPEEAVIQNL